MQPDLPSEVQTPVTNFLLYPPVEVLRHHRNHPLGTGLSALDRWCRCTSLSSFCSVELAALDGPCGIDTGRCRRVDRSGQSAWGPRDSGDGPMVRSLGILFACVSQTGRQRSSQSRNTGADQKSPQEKLAVACQGTRRRGSLARQTLGSNCPTSDKHHGKKETPSPDQQRPGGEPSLRPSPEYNGVPLTPLGGVLGGETGLSSLSPGNQALPPPPNCAVR